MAPRRAACLALLPVLLWAASVLAQARPSPIPQDSRRGYIRHVEEMAVTVDDKAMQLAAGAVIRDQQNLIIVPVTIPRGGDRKSTRLNSSHLGISYAVFCLKKKKK